VHFASFLPNALYQSGLIPNVYYSCAARARFMSEHLLGEAWTEESFSPKRSATQRLIEHFLRR
jgi:hypothetical protein